MEDKPIILISVDLGSNKSSDSMAAVLDLYYNSVHHIIYSTNDKDEVRALSSISEDIWKEKGEKTDCENRNKYLENENKILKNILAEVIFKFDLRLFDTESRTYPVEEECYICNKYISLATIYNSVRLPKMIYMDLYKELNEKHPELLKPVYTTEQEIKFLKEIRKTQTIERMTRTPILSKYRVDEYDRYLAEEGHYPDYLSKEAFEYYYKVYEPWYRKFQKQIKEIMTSPGNLDIDNPFVCGPDKKGF